MRVSPDEQWLVFSSRLVPAALSSRDFAEREATSEARVLLKGARTRPPRKQVSVSGVRDAPQSEENRKGVLLRKASCLHRRLCSPSG